MKALIFDADKSLASIGGPETIQQTFGFLPVTISGGLEQIEALIRQITVARVEKLSHPLFGDTGATDFVLTLKDEVKEQGIGAIVIDSISVVGYQERIRMTKAAGALSMDLQMWGIYGDRLMRFAHMLSRLDIPVIVTCHLDRAQDENGGPIEIPGVKGSAKLEMARFFDVIAYTWVDRGKKGETKFNWRITADGRRSQAKSRLVYPTEFGVVEQDFGPLLKHYQEQGITAPKFLIIGDAGSGKTRSLITLQHA